uniref:Non-specific lipid-transfer protein n=1 Tax=Dianthus caryophyllus TaxID=3570 RepID=D4QD75_DIACA|nr:lipid transfer protein [Dianthus caryophyllus]
MASSSAMRKVACAMILCIVMTAPYATEALTCGQVSGSLASCISYLKGAPGPSGACCGGIKRLNGMAQTPPDRKTACGCLKSAAAAISGINYGLANALPGKCGVSIPYPISPNTDCSRVH